MWLPRVLRRVRLAPEHAAAVAAYGREPRPDFGKPARNLRFVVVDVETTGLRPYRDRLLAIGAVAMTGMLVRLDDTFETTLRQAAPSAPENILVHGIDGTTQTSGVDAAEALGRFLQFVRGDPLVGFHAEFDRTFVSRAMRSALGIAPWNAWLDVAEVAPALFPEHADRAQTLDDWTALFGIENPARHEALADAVATAQLLQVVLARAEQRGISSLAELVKTAREQRWLVQSLNVR
jgi:DNA polymerase III subunit epsilon